MLVYTHIASDSVSTMCHVLRVILPRSIYYDSVLPTDVGLCNYSPVYLCISVASDKVEYSLCHFPFGLCVSITRNVHLQLLRWAMEDVVTNTHT